jgi:glutamate decarboxylase
VVAIAGQTFTGEDDEIQEIHDWLDDYEKKTGVSIPMHIDGASGVSEPVSLPRLQMGLASVFNQSMPRATMPCRPVWAGFKDRMVFNEDLVSTSIAWAASSTATLNFSRSSTVPRQSMPSDHVTAHAVMRYDGSAVYWDRLAKTGKFQIMNKTSGSR